MGWGGVTGLEYNIIFCVNKDVIFGGAIQQKKKYKILKVLGVSGNTPFCVGECPGGANPYFFQRGGGGQETKGDVKNME